VLAAVSLMASRGETTPLSMIMMGGPIDARQSPTAVNDLALQRSHEWFENNVIYRVPNNFPGAGRKVYPGFLQHAGFIAMNPNRHANSHYDYFSDLIKGDNESVDSHRQFYDEYNAVLDMDAPYYLETIDTVFQDFKLVNGTWDVINPQGNVERVRPQDIRATGLLTVEGELDDISGSGQTRAAHNLCTGIPQNKQEHFEVKGAGHYGIFSGRRWREMVYPVIKSFVLSNELAALKIAKPAPKASAPKVAVQALVTPSTVKKTVTKKVAPVAKPSTKPAVKAAVKVTAKATAKPAAKKKPARSA